MILFSLSIVFQSLPLRRKTSYLIRSRHYHYYYITILHAVGRYRTLGAQWRNQDSLKEKVEKHNKQYEVIFYF